MHVIQSIPDRPAARRPGLRVSVRPLGLLGLLERNSIWATAPRLLQAVGQEPCTCHHYTSEQSADRSSCRHAEDRRTDRGVIEAAVVGRVPRVKQVFQNLLEVCPEVVRELLEDLALCAVRELFGHFIYPSHKA